MATRISTEKLTAKAIKALTGKQIKAQRQAALDRSLKPRVKKAGVKVVAKSAGKKISAKAVKGQARQTVLIDEPECDWVCSWEFELEELAAGSRLIAGVDEVGRGPLFGPVVAAAVILPAGVEIAGLLGLNDSKKLTEEERERFDTVVREVAVCWAIAEVDVPTIDRINILQASKLAMKIAVDQLHGQGHVPDCLLIDGNQKIDHVCRQRTIVQGDGRSFSIAAASVIAKVHRDRLLVELDGRYPGYGFATNKGYATPEHRAALLRLGLRICIGEVSPRWRRCLRLRLRGSSWLGIWIWSLILSLN